ncbi:MAG: DUF3857 domain-containing protein [Algibacter sp.]
MDIKNSIAFLFLFLGINIFAQNLSYASLIIPENLKNDAHAVIRTNEVNVTLSAINKMEVTTKRVITVLNKKGDDNVDAYAHYDNNVKIKTLEVLVFNAFGVEIKKFKKNDFKDVSAVSGGTLYSDSRVKYLEYTPINYPYTIEFNCEIETENTAFIMPFRPIEDYFVSVEKSSYTLNYTEENNIRKKEKNFESIELEKEESAGRIFYEVNNLEVIEAEDYSPSFSDIAPKVMFTSKKFTLEGVQTEVEDWNDFGEWMYNDLLKQAYDLPAGTINKMQNLVKNEQNDIDKAKKIYQYVQDKTRYISVQVGIGGWKPFNASEVDRLGYGDCKALTNYTMSLLKAVGIESNYTIVYAGNSQRNIENDFAAMQGNHAILTIPNGDEDIWLECTSQKMPFGFIGDFTDDRDVLVVTPNGGEIKHTKKYSTEENTQTIKATCQLSNTGDIDVSANERSKGIQYNDKYWLETETQRDLDVNYKERWKYINNMTISKMDIVNDKDNIEFNEHIDFKALGYSKVIGERMLVNINVLNRNKYVPDRYRNRKLPFKIKRGFKDVDEVEIKLPEGYKTEAVPEGKSIENKYGSYKTEILKKDENTLVYKRCFIIKDGDFSKEDYASYRDFYKEVSKLDNAKMALIKK